LGLGHIFGHLDVFYCFGQIEFLFNFRADWLSDRFLEKKNWHIVRCLELVQIQHFHCYLEVRMPPRSYFIGV